MHHFEVIVLDTDWTESWSGGTNRLNDTLTKEVVDFADLYAYKTTFMQLGKLKKRIKHHML